MQHILSPCLNVWQYVWWSVTFIYEEIYRKNIQIKSTHWKNLKINENTLYPEINCNEWENNL